MRITDRPRFTKPVRLKADLVEMLSAVVWDDGTTTVSDVLDPLVRPTIVKRFNRLPEDVKARAERRIRGG